MKKKGFSLIELLTVVAIIGIITAVGVVSYTGYVSAARKSSAENAMQQIALAQAEYYSNIGQYFPTTLTCGVATTHTSESIENNLFDGGDIITEESGYQMCIVQDGSSYTITAESSRDGCTLKMSGVSGRPEEEPEGSC